MLSGNARAYAEKHLDQDAILSRLVVDLASIRGQARQGAANTLGPSPKRSWESPTEAPGPPA
jgi:hypothetical protein